MNNSEKKAQYLRRIAMRLYNNLCLIEKMSFVKPYQKNIKNVKKL